MTWLKLGGVSPTTLRVRSDHVRCIAHRSRTRHPRMLTLSIIVGLFSEHDWSREYRKNVRTSMISFCEWARANDMMDENPALQLPKVRPPIPSPRPAPDEVWRDLLAGAPERERLMARLACQAGLRRAEVARCHRDDLVKDRGGWSLIVKGKGDRLRVVPITDDLAATIRGHCERGYLFPSSHRIGGHLSVQYVGVLLSDLMPPGWSMHALRHRFATRGYAGTRNLRAVQEALGHASVATTQRYTLITDIEVRAVAEAAGMPDDVA